MAESLINSIARLRVIERGLLTKETVSRLVSAPSFEECLKILRETGWGVSDRTDGETDEIDRAVISELNSAYALTRELMPDKYAFVTDVFRMRHDITNVKLLYKLRLLGEQDGGARLDAGGVIDEKTLREGIRKGDYSFLPAKISSALEELDVTTYRGADPQAVSSSIDAAYIGYAMSVKNAFVREYFGALADFTNVIAVLRGVGEEYLLPGGKYGAAELAAFREAIPVSGEKALGILKSPLETSALKDAVAAGFAEHLRTGRIAALEKARDDYLIALASEGRSDIDGVAPIVGYMLAKEREAEVVRLILTVKRSGAGMGVLDERSLRLYG